MLVLCIQTCWYEYNCCSRTWYRRISTWYFNRFAIFDAATNDQLNNAVDLTVNAVYQYPTSDLFVTGHSLGGFNAQFIGYALAEGLIGDSDNEGWLDNKLLTKKRKFGSY